ncbi:MAG: tetratricopeptide repeat protein [Syntrophaceae bacterium]|nr:tetratricopeptide repeat protein [Syntrophaceae bacterium]
MFTRKEAENKDSTGKNSYFTLFLVLFITALVFSGSLKLDWTNWDDNLLVYDNPMVREACFQDIFIKPADYNTYNPLVIFSFALEWKLVKDRPFLYHFDNFILHLFCTALVLFFFRRIGLSIWWSGFAALLFGIHPMRVESVAWVSERKDVLCALFYLAALLIYIRYISREREGLLCLTFFFFVLALLSKTQAVVLPFVLFLLDWYFNRKIGLKVFLEKIIFFALSLVIGFLGATFFIKNAFVTTNSKSIVNVFGLLEQVLLGGYAYSVYVLKSIIPYATSILYPTPSSLQTQHFVGGVIAVLIFIGALVKWRKYKFITFGLLFFSFNIFLQLMCFKGSETAFLNDHYTYVAYIGLFFIIAMSMQKLAKRFSAYSNYFTCFAIAFLVVYSIMTIKYIPAWGNSETLWTYVIKKYPHKIATAHLNRGNYWYKNNQSDKAWEDFNMAIKINPECSNAYFNRSVIYLERGETKKALQDYNRYIEIIHPFDARGNLLKLPLSDSFRHRGSIYIKLGQYEKALADFNKAIEFDPFNLDNYYKRALTHMQLREYETAIRDFNLCHQSDPANSDIINNRGVCYLRLGKFQYALADFNKAILLNGTNPSYYVNRAIAYYKLGRLAEARQDVQTAGQMGAVIDPSIKKLLRLH